MERSQIVHELALEIAGNYAGNQHEDFDSYAHYVLVSYMKATHLIEHEYKTVEESTKAEFSRKH